MMVALPGLQGVGEKFFKETRRRGMETQAKPTKALGIIAQFMNSGKRKDGKDLVLSLKDLLFLQVKMWCLDEFPETRSWDGTGGELGTHRYLRHCPILS